MNEIRHLKGNVLIPFVSDLLEQGLKVRITVTGMSMYPFLRENIDSVELAREDFEDINRDDIVLIQRDNGMYVLHRVLKKEKDCFYIVGDAQQWIEGPLYSKQILAKVITIWRKNKQIECTNKSLRLLVALWRRMLPLRYLIINCYGFLRRIISKKKWKVN